MNGPQIVLLIWALAPVVALGGSALRKLQREASGAQPDAPISVQPSTNTRKERK